MKIRLILTLVACVALTLPAAGQQLGTATPHRNCHTMNSLNELIANDPGIVAKMAAIEAHTQANQGLMGQHFGNPNVITIPVVVHVVWNTASENLSTAQIQSQIDVLNEDFRRTNPDASNTLAQFQGVAADSEIEFCLATTDPTGAPTTGITRRQTSVSSFGTSGNPVKFNSSGGTDAWPRDSYMNIWVCDISSGILGYAQFPGGPASTDGIVCDYAYFGRYGSAQSPYNLGRTATHEVGHWLNLRHIWGDGGCGVDDLVADTPVSDGPNYSCSLSHVSCGSVDMVQNYMDYTNDSCMNVFTTGQKNRMRALFASGGFRASILNSTACGPVVPPTADWQVNNLYAALNINGTGNTASTPAITDMCVGDSGTFQFLSVDQSGLFNVGFTLSPMSGGTTPPGSTTPGGQYININLGHPTTYYWGGSTTPGLVPYPGNQVIPFVPAIAVTFSSQMLKIHPSNLDGFYLSAGAQLNVNAAGGTPVSHTLGDDNSVTVSLSDPTAFYGASYTTLYINSNGAVAFNAGSNDFSPTASEFTSQDPRCAGNWSDLAPNTGGTVTSSENCGTVVVSFLNVPEWSATPTVSFDVTFSSSDDTTIDNHSISGGTWGTATIVGFSPGGGASGSSVTWSSLVGGTTSYPVNNAVYEFNGSGATSTFTSITRSASGAVTVN